MATPLLELEGTWEEIVTQIPDFSGQKLRVLVYPAIGNSAEARETRPIAEVLAMGLPPVEQPITEPVQKLTQRGRFAAC